MNYYSELKIVIQLLEDMYYDKENGVITDPFYLSVTETFDVLK